MRLGSTRNGHHKTTAPNVMFAKHTREAKNGGTPLLRPTIGT